MKLSDINEQLDKADFKLEKKKAILALIDIKVENEMEKVLSRFDRIEERLESNIKTFIWVVGVAFAIVSVLLTIIALKG
ncbi:hypothetical protein MTsPCn9_34430 [Croceitalea sp. MTPC9]|uniref:hypothetical protein n=1 Tax=Croceitalea sp. MTPC6 TaxID=3056566 RepID=UPI002B3BAEA4|nr:hypothetical protein MTsPCn6_34520 [Croceitalea sp. MTPC6]GMN18503.1 hypothetical protein MTsPCn9_34430 [Croceitalea sp. MTPC9]